MKTMKYFLSMAALALVGAMTVSCSSDDNIIDQPQQQEVTKNNVVTLTTTVGLDGGAGTTRALDINYTAKTLTKTFAVGETMALRYKNEKGNWVKAVSNALEVGDIADGSKSATFTFTLDTPDKTKTVDYIYPAAIVNELGNMDEAALFGSQDGTLNKIASTFDYSRKIGAWDGENLPSLTLENQLAILAITLKDEAGANDITSSITGMTLSDGTKTYNVTREAVAGPIYVAIFPTKDATITVTATDGTKNYTKTLTTKTYAKGNVYPVSWRMTELPEGALPGKFTINDSGDQVYFSKGNLRYASDTWSFFDNQYDYYTSYSADAWDKFGWSTSATTYGMNTSGDNSDYSGDFVDWGATMGTDWFTLNKDQWTYLFNTRSARSASTVGTTEDARYTEATINFDGTGVNGVILFPDGATFAAGEATWGTINAPSAWGTKCTTAQWTALEAKGCVFLPAAGYRDGEEVNYAGSDGYYWSSLVKDDEEAYYVYFVESDDPDYLPEVTYSDRYNGMSVRLVRPVQ